MYSMHKAHLYTAYVTFQEVKVNHQFAVVQIFKINLKLGNLNYMLINQKLSLVLISKF